MASEPGATDSAASRKWVRQGGLAGLTAAGLFVLSTALTLVAPVGTRYETVADYLHQLIAVLAYAAVLVALRGLHARQRSDPRYGRLGAVGTVLTAVGYGAALLIVVVGIVMGSRVLNEARLVAAALLLLGSAVLGVATLRARAVPGWCGALLIVAFPLGDVANQALDGAEGLLLALLWGSVGIALLKPPGSTSGAGLGPSAPARHRT
jgi:hypothetical protein